MFPFIPPVVVLGLATLSLGGQLASSSWRNSQIALSQEERVGIAGAAVDVAVSMLNKDYQFGGLAWGVPGDLYSQMADFDIASNQTKYKDTLTQLYFPHALTLRANFSDEFVSHIRLDYGLSYGHAAIRAYAAYKDPVFLEYAVQSWWFGRSYTLADADVSSGKTEAKEFTIEEQCQGISMTGGTFHNTLPNDPELNALSTGHWFTLSALLGEATSDPMYLTAAIQAQNFLYAHLMNVLNQVQDSISGRANDSCSLSNIIEPYNSGLMIEGLAVLYSISGNATIQTLLNDILEAAISSTSWQGSNGVIATGGCQKPVHKTGDLNLVRGLTAAYTRNATAPDLRDDLEKYIAVQFNAVVDLATENNSNIYGASWLGPPSSVFSGTNQTTALSALIGAISLRNASETAVPTIQPSQTSPLQTSASSSVSSHSSRKATIIGAIIGSLAIVAAAVGVWVARRRWILSRRISPSMGPLNSSSPTTTAVTPFSNASMSVSIGTASKATGRRAETRYSTHKPGVASMAHTAGAQSRQRSEVARVDPPVQRALPPPLPTEELVRMLNERLQGHQWNDGEAPPEYPD
ncbi:Glycoside hydrolase family 76 protein [Mycena venus]|uniref:Glycoside hydrolase family 76 protein n=1 Tax=Mycena venus TaxID=2733690 RepID=A0A8H7CIX3_9AGAR|nr:Glycoside hydrolase family 76 protein [Mycena venus]